MTEDKMGRGSDEIASVQSSNTISLSSPYDGEQRATLSLRKLSKNGNQFVISIERGQIICPTDGCGLLVRIDGGEPFNINVSHPKDGSSDMVVGNINVEELRKMKQSSTILVEITIFQNGEKVMEFDSKDTPFIGEKGFLISEIKELLKKDNIPVVKKHELTMGDSSFDICKKVALGKDESDKVIKIIKNNKNEVVVENYQETMMYKNSCLKGRRGMLMEFFSYT